MSEEKLAFVGKQVKDIYGTYIGKVVGIITEIDGEIEAVGVDCGSSGIKQLPYEQLVLQGDYVFFIPKWRIEAQKLIRQKSLTLRRIKALEDIVAENDSMKEDAELVYLKYERKLVEIGETEKAVSDKLTARLAELDAEVKQVKVVFFDAKLQFRSNEMREETYQQIKMNTDELIEHITNEKTEIGNVRGKISTLTIENVSAAQSGAPVQVQTVGGEPVTDTPAKGEVPQVVNVQSTEEKPVVVTAAPENHNDAWLNQVIQQ